MKFVAAARLRRAQERALAARPYAKEIARVLRSTMSRIGNPQHPLLAKRPEEKILAVVLTGERGLCGAFNSNILRKAAEFFRANAGKKILALPVGKKGRDALHKQRHEFVAEYVNVLARVEFGVAKKIAAKAAELYAAGEVDAVYMVFNEFKNVMAPNPTIEILLPVGGISGSGEKAAGDGISQVDYIYEQSPVVLLDRLLPRYVETQILRAMLESSAAEYAARMTAMESATKNAGDVIEALTLQMNKVRQAAITKEIIEIISGASSTA